MQNEEWKVRDDIIPKDKESWQLVRKKMEQCNELAREAQQAGNNFQERAVALGGWDKISMGKLKKGAADTLEAMICNELLS